MDTKDRAIVVRTFQIFERSERAGRPPLSVRDVWLLLNMSRRKKIGIEIVASAVEILADEGAIDRSESRMAAYVAAKAGKEALQSWLAELD